MDQVEAQGQLQLEDARHIEDVLPVKRGRGRPRKVTLVTTEGTTLSIPAAVISTTESKTPASNRKVRKHKKQKSNKKATKQGAKRKATKKVARKVQKSVRKYTKTVPFWMYVRALFSPR